MTSSTTSLDEVVEKASLAVGNAIKEYINNNIDCDIKLNHIDSLIIQASKMYVKERTSDESFDLKVVGIHIIRILEKIIFPMEKDETALHVLVYFLLPTSQGGHLFATLQNSMGKLRTAEALSEASTRLYDESCTKLNSMAKLPLKKLLPCAAETSGHQRAVHTLTIASIVASTEHVFVVTHCYNQAVRMAKIIVTINKFDESSKIGIFVKKASEWAKRGSDQGIFSKDMAISTIKTMRSNRSYECEYATLAEANAMKTIEELK